MSGRRGRCHASTPDDAPRRDRHLAPVPGPVSPVVRVFPAGDALDRDGVFDDVFDNVFVLAVALDVRVV